MGGWEGAVEDTRARTHVHAGREWQTHTHTHTQVIESVRLMDKQDEQLLSGVVV